MPSSQNKPTVDALAALVGLKIPPAHQAGVQRAFDQLAATADLVMSFPIDATIESAAVYTNDRP
jgi:Protein of unknown function (DUF4089)